MHSIAVITILLLATVINVYSLTNKELEKVKEMVDEGMLVFLIFINPSLVTWELPDI